MPLQVMDLRVPVEELATCSGASEKGAGVCYSTKLSDAGIKIAAEATESKTRLVDGEVLLIELFSGIGGARAAFTLLGFELGGYLASEVEAAPKKVVKQQWPSVVEWPRVE